MQVFKEEAMPKQSKTKINDDDIDTGPVPQPKPALPSSSKNMNDIIRAVRRMPDNTRKKLFNLFMKWVEEWIDKYSQKKPLYSIKGM